MKIIIIIATSLILYCSSTIAQTKPLEVDIRGRGCNGGSGVCTTGSTGLRQTNTNMKNFNITKLTSKSMVIEIELSKLNSEEQKVFLGKEYSTAINQEELFFIQEQDFIFDINTLLYLELDPAYRLLKRGTYPLQIVNDSALVTIELSVY
jgi:hypothetical protein